MGSSGKIRVASKRLSYYPAAFCFVSMLLSGCLSSDSAQFGKIVSLNQSDSGYSASVSKSSNPELVVTHLSTLPTFPLVDQPVTFTAVIENQGQSAFSAAEVLPIVFNVDGLDVSSADGIQALAAGTSVSVTGTATWDASEGSHTLNVAITESNQALSEGASINTDLSLNFSVGTSAITDGLKGFFAMTVFGFESTPSAAFPQNMGFSSIRTWDSYVSWNNIEYSRGNYYYGGLDGILNTASANNVDVLYTFGQTPYWALPSNIVISAISRSSSGVVTVTTATPHGLNYVPYDAANIQSRVSISGVTDTSFNGAFYVSGTPSATTLNYTQTGLAAASSTAGKLSAICTGYYSGAHTPGCAQAPANLADWDAFVTAMANHVGTKIKYWEMWNEANLHGTWVGDTATLVTMTEHARSIIKAVNPSAVILAPSATEDYPCGTNAGCGANWLNGYLAAGGKNYVDAVAVHNYPVNAAQPEGVINQIAAERAAMSTNGVGSLPIFDTESNFDGLTDSNAQLQSMARHLILQASGGVAKSFWYDYADLVYPTPSPSVSPTSNSPVGLTPAGSAYPVLVSWLNGASFTVPCALSTSLANTWTCGLTLSGGQTAELVWNTVSSQNFAAASGYTSYLTLDGDSHSIVGNSVPISLTPVLLVKNQN